MKLKTYLPLAAVMMCAAGASQALSGENIYLYHNNRIIFSEDVAAVDRIAWEDNGTQVSLYNAAGEQLFTSGIEEVDCLTSDCHLPVADLLDVVFNADGTATDISPMGNEVKTGASSKISVYYNEQLQRNTAAFANSWAGTAEGYYRVDYADNPAFMEGLADGHTIECVVSAAELKDSEAKFFSSHAAGGTGLMICNKNGHPKNAFTFLPNTGGTYRWGYSDIEPETDRFYHVVGVYDKAGNNVRIYIDGELKCTTTAGGVDYKHSGDKWFGIGGDPEGNVAKQAWHGEVALARVYSTPLNDYEVAALYNAAMHREEEPVEPVDPVVPEADVLDVKFNADGTATDISPMGNKVETIAGDGFYTYYSNAFGGYVAHFSNSYAGLADGYYRVDYKDNDFFKTALQHGHTLEAVVMTDIDIPDTEAKPFSNHGAGGTGLMVSNSGNAGGNYLCFLPHTGGDYRYANSHVKPQNGRFYHIVGIWDAEEGKVKIYVNGRLAGSGNAPGELRFPSPDSLHWFCIGGDPGTRDGKVVGEQAWHGDVAMARIYDKALTDEEAIALWSVVKEKVEYTEPELATDIRLYSLPVLASGTYPVYAAGLQPGDVITMTSSNNTSVKAGVEITSDGAKLTLPADIATGTYRFVLSRGDEQQTLGNAQLTVVESMPKGAQVIAHRGYWKAEGAVQNSRASLQGAISIGAFGSETDVWVTTDNHLMINHDRTLNGVTLCQSTYDQCKDLTLGNGEKIPELHELLTIVKNATDSHTRFVIEVKDHGSKDLDVRAAEQTVAAVAAAGMTGSEKIKYISFSRDACEKLIELEPQTEIAFICAKADNALTPADLHTKGYHGFDYEIGLLRNNLGWIDQAHSLGLTVNVWTVNNASDIVDMMQKNVDYVTTDNPTVGLDIKAHFDANGVEEEENPEQPEFPEPDPNLPKADLLDLVFNEDGTATDISPMQNSVTSVTGGLAVSRRAEFGRNGVHFSNPYAGAATGYYRVDYADNEAFLNGLADGHTLECVVSADEIRNSEAKFFSSHAAGGTGLMICNDGGGRGGNYLTFLPNVSETGASTWRWAMSHVKPENGKYYHILAVYNKEEQKARIYINGELAGEADAPGNFRHANAAARWFGIGCDPNEKNSGEQAWHGDVIIARVYNTPLTAEDALGLYKAAFGITE